MKSALCMSFDRNGIVTEIRPGEDSGSVGERHAYVTFDEERQSPSGNANLEIPYEGRDYRELIIELVVNYDRHITGILIREDPNEIRIGMKGEDRFIRYDQECGGIFCDELTLKRGNRVKVVEDAGLSAYGAGLYSGFLILKGRTTVDGNTCEIRMKPYAFLGMLGNRDLDPDFIYEERDETDHVFLNMLYDDIMGIRDAYALLLKGEFRNVSNDGDLYEGIFLSVKDPYFLRLTNMDREDEDAALNEFADLRLFPYDVSERNTDERYIGFPLFSYNDEGTGYDFGKGKLFYAKRSLKEYSSCRYWQMMVMSFAVGKAWKNTGITPRIMRSENDHILIDYALPGIMDEIWLKGSISAPFLPYLCDDETFSPTEYELEEGVFHQQVPAEYVMSQLSVEGVQIIRTVKDTKIIFSFDLAGDEGNFWYFRFGNEILVKTPSETKRYIGREQIEAQCADKEALSILDESFREDELSNCRPFFDDFSNGIGIVSGHEEEAEGEDAGDKPQTISEVYSRIRQTLGFDYLPDSICQTLIRNIPFSHISHIYGEKAEPGKDEKVPTFVFMGSAGTGKTTLARAVAEKLLNMYFIPVTANGLQGKFQGQGESEIAKKIEEAQDLIKKDHHKPAGERKKGAVIFIDEAYELFGSEIDFAKETVSTLLQLMSGDLKEVKVTEKNNQFPDRIIEVGDGTIFFLAGYEAELTKALSKNQGLFRRMVKVRLPDAKKEELFLTLKDGIRAIGSGEQSRIPDPEKEERIEEGSASVLFRELIKPDVMQEYYRFFGWAGTPEHSKYFGAYGGVKNLIRKIRNEWIELQTIKKHRNESVTGEEAREILLSVLKENREDISRTYSVTMLENALSEFRVSSEIRENLGNYLSTDSLKRELKELADMIVDPEKYRKNRIVPPKGVLLYGSPGTGKTYLARCLAGEISQRFVNDRSGRTVGFVAVGAAELLGSVSISDRARSRQIDKVSLLFSMASQYDQFIVFIDEIDAIGRRRNSAGENRNVLTQLFKEMDGFEDRNNVLVLAATNDPESLDPALIRGGRFDRRIEIDGLNAQLRLEVIRLYLKKEAVDDDVRRIGKLLRGYEAADIRSVIEQTWRLHMRTNRILDEGQFEGNEELELQIFHRKTKDGYLRENPSSAGINMNDPVTWEAFFMDMQEVIARNSIGERNGGEDAEEFVIEKNRGLSATAIHEVGHALVMVLTGNADMISRITISARKNTLGYVSYEADTKGERTLRRYRSDIMRMMGGRVAEELIYGKDEISSGAISDIEHATDLSRRMVEDFGMSEELGFMALRDGRYGYLGESASYICAEETRAKADRLVQEMLKDLYRETLRLLEPNKELIKTVAKRVFEEEEMSGEAFRKLCEEYGIC